MQVRSLASGSSGNSFLVQTEKAKILIDAGLSARAITERLHFCGAEPKELDAILVTHEHIDHVKGIGVLSRRFDLPVFANVPTWESMGIVAEKVPLSCQQSFVTGSGFQIGDLWVKTFPTSHDSGESVGFVFYHQESGTKIGFATDLGEVTPSVAQALEGCTMLVVETNHDLEMLWKGSYPWPLKKRIAGNKGHLSNQAGAELIRQSIRECTRAIWLAHLSKENNRPQLAYSAVARTLTEMGVDLERGVHLTVVPRETVGPLYQEK